ncbi:ATP-binding cassette domain-containing protein [Schleiferiaceae bacterium]|nr:ATP-binding cassette domain-containing protein [Schleiferiaceae bacterium]MDB2581608.1 ATP-binding cassette domain-containing protein [Schleiferiaceae bacterium]
MIMDIQLSPSFSITYPDMTFPDGITLVTGPSGVGKTTLLRALHGELGTSFSSIVKGQKTSLMPQQQYWIGYMTMYEQLSMTAGEQWQTIAETLGLQSHFHKLPDQLSIGQQQRFWLSWVLADNADWILLDEPTSALDDDWATAAISLFDRFRRENEKTKIIIVTHDVRLLQGNIHNHRIAL